MATTLTFEKIRDLLKTEEDYAKDIESLMSLLTITTFAFGAVPGASAIAALKGLQEVLQHSDSISKVYGKIVSKWKPRPGINIGFQGDVLHDVYTLTCYVAFFETLEKTLPYLSKQLNITDWERLSITAKAIKQLETDREDGLGVGQSTQMDPNESLFELSLPHPGDSFEKQKIMLEPLYAAMNQSLIRFVEGLNAWDELEPVRKMAISEDLGRLPIEALECFESLYLRLAEEFTIFKVWSDLRGHEVVIKAIDGSSKNHDDNFNVLRNQVDIGLREIGVELSGIPKAVAEWDAIAGLSELNNRYIYDIKQPVVRDAGAEELNVTSLQYPAKEDAYIPQQFKVLRYQQGMRMESEGVWSRLPTREDLGQFLLSYLESPVSVQKPLIIVGHPGSGKSLLASVLSARLVSDIYTPIRVELRNINAENEIIAQIEEQVRIDTSRELSWANCSGQFSCKPPVVILDGYDELLQASGKVFSGYLRKTMAFQEYEIALGRAPVRTIVTSRITLIDKAEIPADSTVLRLLEFDSSRQNHWARVWNLSNLEYFLESGVEPFAVPKESGLASLAKQPLLLLMLAIYDSESNELSSKKDLNRAALYDGLLRRFVFRELGKDLYFGDLEQSDRERLIQDRMEKLGVVAVAMFTRRALHIRLSELNKDLEFLGLNQAPNVASGSALSAAHLIIGGFFFVQESKSSANTSGSEQHGSDASFEFLHNTFGEFLVARYLLTLVINEVETLIRSEHDDLFRSMAEARWVDSVSVPKEWYVAFSVAPLFLRPVIISMLQEWFPHVLKARSQNRLDVVRKLNWIVVGELRRVLGSANLPSGLTNAEYSVNSIPVLGRLAIYTVNLVATSVALSDGEFEFEESVSNGLVEEASTWDRLISVWRSWFSLDSLAGLSAIWSVRREGASVTLYRSRAAEALVPRRRIEMLGTVGRSLGDETLEMLQILLGSQRPHEAVAQLERGASINERVNFGLEDEILLKKLRLGNSLRSGFGSRHDVFVAGEIIEFWKRYRSYEFGGSQSLDWELLTELLDELIYSLTHAVSFVRVEEVAELHHLIMMDLSVLVRVRRARRIPVRLMENLVRLTDLVNRSTNLGWHEFSYLLEQLALEPVERRSPHWAPKEVSGMLEIVREMERETFSTGDLGRELGSEYLLNVERLLSILRRGRLPRGQ